MSSAGEYSLSPDSREGKNCDPKLVFTETEIEVIKKIVKLKRPKWRGKTLLDLHFEVAKLGGFLARKSDGPPGFITTWKGYLKIQFII